MKSVGQHLGVCVGIPSSLSGWPPGLSCKVTATHLSRNILEAMTELVAPHSLLVLIRLTSL